MSNEDIDICERCEKEINLDNDTYVIHAVFEQGEQTRATLYCDSSCMIDFLSTLEYCVSELASGKTYEEVFGIDE